MNLHTLSKVRRMTLGAAPLLLAGSLQAAVVVTITDSGPALNSSTPPSTDMGTVNSSIAAAPGPITYTLNGVDLASVGGTANEQIVFTVSFSATGGSVAYNTLPNGNIYVGPGGGANQVDVGETLTATVGLSSTTFSGGLGNLSIGFNSMSIAGFGTGEAADVTHDAGTINQAYIGNGTQAVSLPLSSAFTLTPTAGNSNLGAYTVEITAIPEPRAALLGLLGCLLLLRRRR